MNTKQITVKTDDAVCAFCKMELQRGHSAIAKFKRDRTGVITAYFCDEICLADHKEDQEVGVNKLLNQLSVQFN